MNAKTQIGMNWKDYGVSFLLLSPLILVLVLGEFTDVVGYILVAVVGGTPPLIYLDSRRLGSLRIPAVGWALGSLLFWILFAPMYVFSKRRELKKRKHKVIDQPSLRAKMNYCTSCGEEIKENSGYCGNCGQELMRQATVGDIRCPICGSETIIRTAKQGTNAGRQFHVCSRYPACKGRIAVV